MKDPSDEKLGVSFIVVSWCVRRLKFFMNGRGGDDETETEASGRVQKMAGESLLNGFTFVNICPDS